MNEILKYTGIGGLGIFLFLFLVKGLIKSEILKTNHSKQSYKVLLLIIWLSFVLSISCLVIYGLQYYKTLNKHDIKPSIENNEINGNGNVIIAGNNNNYKLDQIEFSGPDYKFLDFMQEHSGQNVFLNCDLPIKLGGGSFNKEINYDTIDQGFIDLDYTFVDGKKMATYIDGDLKFFTVKFLIPDDTCNIFSENDGHGFSHMFYEELIIIIEATDYGSMKYDRGSIYLNGYFRPYYDLHNGCNTLTIRSK